MWSILCQQRVLFPGIYVVSNDGSTRKEVKVVLFKQRNLNRFLKKKETDIIFGLSLDPPKY